jgi:16S rRNA (uracil1498-N3)-methyltransferase
LKEEERKGLKRRKRREGENRPVRDRIVLNHAVKINQEVLIQGPPLEALRFQRARGGSIITLTDSEGRDFRGRILRISKEEASVLVFEAFTFPIESLLEIVLLQALPKKERMEWIIQKATELGVSTIVPFKSERSISLEERESKQKKAHRWQEIAIKATQQSRRARVPQIGSYCSFQEALKWAEEEGLKILLWEKEGRRLKEVLRTNTELSNKDTVKRIYLMVGPEGGFTREEVGVAIEKGFIPVKLGHRILRTETAAITLIGILQYELGDLSGPPIPPSHYGAREGREW